jgi:hypothetical protein
VQDYRQGRNPSLPDQKVLSAIQNVQAEIRASREDKLKEELLDRIGIWQKMIEKDKLKLSIHKDPQSVLAMEL